MKVIFVIPAYNDWNSLKILSKKIRDVSIEEKWSSAELVIVNDASTQELDTSKETFALKCTILNLISNQGNQKAISIGLSYIDEKINDFDYIIVMDADGEDKPSDVVRLIEEAKKNDLKKIVFVERAKRNEGLFYIFFFTLYKALFNILTGQKINLGHFSCIPKISLKKVLSVSGIGIHYVAAIIKSKLPFAKVVCDKGERITGVTKQNKNMLIFHGLASMTVYVDIITLRFLLISLFSMFLTLVGIIIVFYIKIFTDISSQNWATTTSIGLAIIFTIFFFTSFFSLLTLLNKRENPALPTNSYKHHILNIINL